MHVFWLSTPLHLHFFSLYHLHLSSLLFMNTLHHASKCIWGPHLQLSSALQSASIYNADQACFFPQLSTALIPSTMQFCCITTQTSIDIKVGIPSCTGMQDPTKVGISRLSFCSMLWKTRDKGTDHRGLDVLAVQQVAVLGHVAGRIHQCLQVLQVKATAGK